MTVIASKIITFVCCSERYGGMWMERTFLYTFSVDPTPDDLIVSVWQRGDKPMVSFVRENLWDFVPALYKACLGTEYAS
jgi:hypothetical protein